MDAEAAACMRPLLCLLEVYIRRAVLRLLEVRVLVCILKIVAFESPWAPQQFITTLCEWRARAPLLK